MDTAASENEVRLRKGTSLNERLILAGVGVVLCLVAIPGLVALPNVHWSGIGAIVALLIGCLMLGRAFLVRNVVWIITPGEILIGEQRPFGQLHRRLVRNDEISEMHLRKDSANPTRFSLAFQVESGDVLTSPPLPDVTQMHETTVGIARLLQLPAPEPVNNPLDVGNAEITLGSPVSPDFGRVIRMTVPVVAGLCTLPFLIAFWIGESELTLGFLLPLGLLAAFALYRYAHRLTGAFWIIRHGEIRIERIALNGEPSAETIRAGDVAVIEVGKPDPEDRTCSISIRLRTGQTFRSPTRHNESEADAVCAEIMRRLNGPPDTGTLTG
jgi:hypothetical protein